MKLQIEGQSLRVRIGEEELAALLAGQPLVSRTRFSHTLSQSCTLRAVAGAAARFSGHADAWIIDLPATAVREHAATLPTREGLTFALESGDGEPLVLLFDVDVRDSVRHRRAK